MIKHVFIFGVVLPTIITIIFFVGFLICWFRFSLHERIFVKRKPGRKKPFAAHEINSTQKIVQYGQEEEELDNERNSKFDNCNDDSDKDPGEMGIKCGSQQKTTANKYVITPSQIEYHYQENLKCLNGNDPADGSTECSLRPTISDTSGGVTNTAITVSPSMELEKTDSKQGDLLVQHTFHFPNLSHCEANPQACQLEECHFYGESEEDSDNDHENYGHFVPISEVQLSGDKKKQFYQMYGCDGLGRHDGSTSGALVNEHLTPLQEV